MEISHKNSQAVTNYSDEELFILMSFKDENEVDAQEAFTIFYNRYKDFLWNLCLSVCYNCNRADNEELAKDVFQNTTISIYRYSHTFNSSKSKVTTWMSRIAKNEMYILLSEFKEIRIDEEMEVMLESDISDQAYNDFEFETPQQKALEEALKILSDRDQEILLTYMMYEDGNKHLPDKVLQYLINKYATTPENLRQVKGRSLKRIKNHILNNINLPKN
jgi:RNA polymerase sigma factor (sigma-70 family)